MVHSNHKYKVRALLQTMDIIMLEFETLPTAIYIRQNNIRRQLNGTN